jgi:hypothetical protein
MAAATAIITTGLSLASAGASFAQASKQNRLEKEAAEAAAKYMEEAKKKFDVNYMEGVQVPLEGYETATRMNQASAAQSLEALKESGQRALIGGVGRIQEQSMLGAEQLRRSLQQDLYNRDIAVAEEASGNRDTLAGIDLGAAAGAQQAAADAQAKKIASIESGFSTLSDAATGLAKRQDLYKEQQKPTSAPGYRVNQSIFVPGSIDRNLSPVGGNSQFNFAPLNFQTKNG